jgi:hypothetical protein
MANLTLTALRQQSFKIFDQVIQTGIPVEIERHGHRLKIVLDDPPRKLANLRPHTSIVGDADDVIDLDTGKWQVASGKKTGIFSLCGYACRRQTLTMRCCPT